MGKLSFREGMWSLYCHTVADQGCSPSPVNRNWIEAKQEVQARHCWGLCGSRVEQKQTTVSLACWLPQGWMSLFLTWSEGRRMSKGSGQRGGLGGLPTSLGGVCVCVCVCSGHAQYPVFASDTLILLQALEKWQLGFLVYLCLLGPASAPTEHAHSHF